MLCETCKSVFAAVHTTAWIKSDGYPVKKFSYHQSKTMLESSAKRGCYICSSVNEFHPVIELHDFYEDLNEHLLFIADSMFTMTEATPRIAELSRASLATRSTGSQAAIDLVTEWLFRCSWDHSPCAKNSPPAWYPSRLLQLGESNVRMISTSCEPPSGTYATLSHCWGTIPFETLSTDNKESFERGLPLSWFPDTFRDAIYFVWRLGLRYLWIDCFCILQCGEPEEVSRDQSVEISSMKNVYANSFLNISAAHGANPFKGCFVGRNRHDGSATIEYPTAEGLYSGEVEHVLCDLGIGKGKRQYQIVNYNYRHQLQDSLYYEHAIFSRGWVMQERMLSPRVLHFGRNQLHWECTGFGWASEEFPYGPGEYSFDRPFRLQQQTGYEGSWWHNIVQAYSRLSLSRPKEDRHVAIGGIAEYAAQLFHDKYIAGAFRNTIILDLDFQCDPFRGYDRLIGWSEWTACTGDLDKDFPELPGPSWSWTSKRFPVDFEENNHPREYLAEMHDADVQLMDPNIIYGAVGPAKLVLKGRIIQGTIPQPLSPSTYAEVDSLQVEIALDENPLHPKNALDSKLCILLLTWYVTNSPKADIHEAIEQAQTEPMVGLHLSGIVLQKESDGAYRRIGAMDSVHSSEGGDKDDEPKLLKLWTEQDETFLTLK